MSAARPSVVLMGDTLNFGGTEGQFVEVACGLDRTRWDLDVACIRAEDGGQEEDGVCPKGRCQKNETGRADGEEAHRAGGEEDRRVCEEDRATHRARTAA